MTYEKFKELYGGDFESAFGMKQVVLDQDLKTENDTFLDSFLKFLFNL